MLYYQKVDSPLGEITIASDVKALTGLWFKGQRYFGSPLTEAKLETDLPVLDQAKEWLAWYFEESKPSATISSPLSPVFLQETMPAYAAPAPTLSPSLIPLAPSGTEYQKKIWQILLSIPYGERWTYGQVGEAYERIYGIKTSARAVGGAVGKNPISLLIPCHRVVAAGGGLGGYAGGLERKEWLLHWEKDKKLLGVGNGK